MLDEVMTMRQRLAAGDSETHPLSTGWHAFELLRSACRSCEGHGSVMFAAYTLSAASAVKARNILQAAPSMQPIGPAAVFAVPDDADLVAASTELADLAAALAAFLAASAKSARDQDDADAFQRAAREAENIRGLLTTSP